MLRSVPIHGMGRLPVRNLKSHAMDDRFMFEFMEGFWYFVIAGAVYLAVLGVANLKRADSE